MDEGFWAVFYFAVILKVPVLFSLWVLWKATRGEDAPTEEKPDDDGGQSPHRPRPRPSLPHAPRRGGHAGRDRGAAPASPPRIRLGRSVSGKITRLP